MTPASEIAGSNVDSVYFLMSPGWSSELRSNRWHFAARWARNLPVVLVQPLRSERQSPSVQPEMRIPNVEILSIVAASPLDYLKRSLVQAAQLMEHMELRAHKRPLLWCYNPNLAGAYAAVPATARIFHATENYFDFEGLPALFLDNVVLALTSSDLVVAVSGGVAESAAEHIPIDRIAEISNGCDTAQYTPTGPKDAELAHASAGYERLAVYAGNVNDRLDFALLNRTAEAYPRTFFAMYGPVADLRQADAQAWEAFGRRSNVRHFGAVAPEQLPALYRTADVGIIPYKQTPWLVRNGFPLKALEMCATGLPTVASLMEPLRGVAAALVVAEDDDAFVRALSSTDRRTLVEAARAELASVCAANDYDLKFAEIVARSSDLLARESLSTHVDVLIERCGGVAWQRACASHAWTFADVRSALAAQLYGAVGEALPPRVRRAIPESVRNKARQRFAA